MKIDTFNLQRAYNLNTLRNDAIEVKSNSSVKKLSENNTQASTLEKYNHKRIVTGDERKFFVNMFPESSKQLMTHEVFTRAGKLQNSAIQKGSLIDGRI
ncbi:MAG: hypothetical protein KIT33_13830 [Candidatus Kapabacteria bacterium]|nr:hypothetical protein [Ignavibacteriota bacterium]MCW5886045.1 hypothetical protein [Candidatus Kapabacteria bacterium]